MGILDKMRSFLKRKPTQAELDRLDKKKVEGDRGRMEDLRARLDAVNPGCVLQVDGGVDLNTADVCKTSGAEVLVAGSAYFKAADRAAFVKTIQG